MTEQLSKTDTHQWAAPAVLLVGAFVSAILIAGYAWQSSESDSSLDSEEGVLPS